MARTLLRGGALPAKARIDAVHAAIAATNGIDYLLTWNMRHLGRSCLTKLFAKSGFAGSLAAHYRLAARPIRAPARRSSIE